jgi:PAS domain S-box-containing protein
VNSNGTHPSPPGGLSLGTVVIRAPDDFVALSRRTRSAGEDFGLQPGDIRRLAAATFEAARLVAPSPGLSAEIRLADGPSLQVLFRVPLDAAKRDLSRSHIESGLAGLNPLVHKLEIEDTSYGLSISLRSLFPTTASRRFQALPSETSPTEPAGSLGIPDDELRRQHTTLKHANKEMQDELQETNRGVIAVYAELDDQADQLRQAEDRLRLLLDSVHDYAICMLSPSGEVTSWNAGGERLFAYAADEIIGRNFACFYTAVERDNDVPREQLREAQEHGGHEGECQRVRHGGSVFDAHVVLTPVRRKGELHGFSLVVRDVTERKRLEDDLRRRADELAAANRAKEDFLATLSHELRTPLNAMLGWTRLLRMGKLNAAAAARALETIERNAHMQEQLIADILDVSRIVTGKLRIELRPIDLTPIVEAALDAVKPAAEAKGIHLDGDAEFSGTVLGDPDRLQQVVWNLLANAIKFTPAGGHVSIAVSHVGQSAVITVSDSGEGIAPELLPFVFDRFRQGDGSVTRPHGGLGLGLSIVRHIVELHGGKVQAKSAGLGQGSSFSVHLPVRATQHAGRAADHMRAGATLLAAEAAADPPSASIVSRTRKPAKSAAPSARTES